MPLSNAVNNLQSLLLEEATVGDAVSNRFVNQSRKFYHQYNEKILFNSVFFSRTTAQRQPHKELFLLRRQHIRRSTM